MKYIDAFLNQITMYRLVLYYLIVLLVYGVIASAVGWLPYDPLSMVLTTGFLLGGSLIGNDIFVRVFKAVPNVESVYISALILALIISPVKTFSGIPLLFWAASWMVGSKFIFNIHRKHIFNPVGIAVVMTALFIGKSATWWAGSAVMLPIVIPGGLLIVRKLRRTTMIATFLVVALATMVTLGLFKGTNPLVMLQKAILDSPLLFFAFVMLTEPLTTPATKQWRVIYAAIVGFLFAPQLQIGSFFTTPEIALVIGNVFSFLVSPPYKLMLTLKQKLQLSPDLYDFLFVADQPFNFVPGQYLEWTVGHDNPDERGNRRYFTLANSPTEPEVRMGVKFYQPASSYKRALLEMEPGEVIGAGQLTGDFTLPKDPAKKLVFMAGGIGITPFRSMIKYLVDKNEKRDIVLMYANKHEEEIVYQDVFAAAEKQLGIRTMYVLSDKDALPADWTGQVGRITPEMIKAEIPDYLERLYYLSGPHTMVMAYEEVLQQLGVPRAQIITDFFPGFA